MPQFNIRQLTESDARIFHELRLKGLEDIPQAFGSSYEEEKDFSDDDIIRRMRNGLVFGGFVDDILRGVGGLYQGPHLHSMHVGNIWGVYVDPDFRKLGMGRAILQNVLASIPNDIEQVRLGVGSHNTPAKNLYESLGFQQCGYEEKVLKINNEYIDEILMVKFIS